MSLRAAALVAAGQILAKSIQATGGLSSSLGRALVYVLALAVLRVPLVALPADADAVAGVGVLDAALARRTWIGVGAAHSLRGNAAITVRVATGAAWALAQVAAGCIRANGLLGAGIGPRALVDVVAASRESCVASVTGSTQALSLSVGQHALGMGAAVLGFAGMTAIVANIRFRAQAALGFVTDGIAGTVLAAGAAHNGHAAHTGIRIGDGVLRAATSIPAAGHVHALGSGSTLAGPRPTLVHVHALGMRIARVAGRAGARVASGGVRASRIQTAASKWSMECIALIDIHASRRDIARVVGPSLLAHAVGFILIGFAVGMVSAPDIFAGLLAGHSRGTAHIAGLAVTAVGSGSVQALRVGTTDVCMGAALIDVHTTSSNRLEAVQAEALILDALCVVGAIEVAGAEDVDVHLLAGHLGIGFAIVTLRALAIVTRRGILAHGMLSTRLIQGRALVNVHASSERIAGVVRLAGAHEAADGVRADGVLPTRIILTLVDVYAVSEFRSVQGQG